MKIFKKILLLNVLTITILISGCEKTKEISHDITTIKTTNKQISIYDKIDLFLDNLSSLYSYEIKVESIATCTKGIISYTQNTYETTVKKDGIFYTRTNSNSLFVKINTLTTYSSSKVLIEYKDKEESYTIDEYKEKRGYTPFDRLIQGFVVNKDTIIDPSFIINEDETISISFNLDLIDSSSLVGKQMKDYSNMKDIPIFTNINTTLLLTKDLLPIEINTVMDFTASVSIINDGLFHQELKYTYSLINSEVTIPSF